MKLTLRLLALLLSVDSVSAAAETHLLQVSRKGSNIYQVEGKELMVVTLGCNLLAYFEDVILESSPNGGRMTFVYNKDKCEVKGLYAPKVSEPGRYAVTLSLKAENWYEIFGTNTYVKTQNCRVMVLGQEAFLLLQTAQLGQISFKDGDNCKVESFFSKQRW